MICENCGVDFCYLNRYCSNCRWDRQPERGPSEELHEYDIPRIDKVEKKTLETFIRNFNGKVIGLNNDKYKTKQHLIDEWHEFCSYFAERYDLDTGVKYYEVIE